MSFEESLKERMAPFAGNPRTEKLNDGFKRALDARNRIVDGASQIAANAHLSPAGKIEAIKKIVEVNRPHIAAVRQTLSEAHADFEQREKMLLPPPPDKADAVGAILRVEERRALTAMQPSNRIQKLHNENCDPLTLQAALERPSSCGLSQDDHAKLLKSVVDRVHPGKMAQIESDREALTLLTQAASYLEATTTAVTNPGPR